MAELKKTLQDKKVLIVDDESLMRVFLNGIIKRIGFKSVSEARDGKSALDMLSAKPFDLVFCDWEMPGMNGLELYQKIKEVDEYKHLIFIMTTGNTGSAHVKEAIDNGIRFYIAKPFNESSVRKQLAKALA
ncbi:MAG: response regulator [Gammaproteobacteria bacterium]|nr:response regulator [Gammaproteobacteria bacterium]